MELPVTALIISSGGLVGKDNFVAEGFESLDQIGCQALGLEFVQIVVPEFAVLRPQNTALCVRWFRRL